MAYSAVRALVVVACLAGGSLAVAGEQPSAARMMDDLMYGRGSVGGVALGCVLGAAVLAAEHRWDQQQTALMLEDESADSFSFDDDSFAWREWKIDLNSDYIPRLRISR